MELHVKDDLSDELNSKTIGELDTDMTALAIPTQPTQLQPIHTSIKHCYINGEWVSPKNSRWMDLIDPATELTYGHLALASSVDVGTAVKAARCAFNTFSDWTVPQRVALLSRVRNAFECRREDFAQAMRQEIGVPIAFARDVQVRRGTIHLDALLEVMKRFEFESLRGRTLERWEPIGICGLITPWNWPINQIMLKVAPALAAGCAMVLKPSEFAPLTANLFAEVLHEAGVPPGVFNMIHGLGQDVGSAISEHPEIDMVSFTGSTRAGVQVAKSAAASVKRVSQELGGKSANIIFEDVDLQRVVAQGVSACFANAGQSCSAPTRMLVPRRSMEQAAHSARMAAQSFALGLPSDPNTRLGPLVNAQQFERVQRFIKTGIEEGATLVTGGLGRPQGLARGWFVRPTVFSNVDPKMTVAREEIFGPVLSIIPYDSEEQAVEIANGTDYGLAAYVQTENPETARRVAKKLRAGSIYLNQPSPDYQAPVGGMKRSGNGRERGEAGLREYLEMKCIVGY